MAAAKSDHSQIYAALRARDPRAAGAAARAHLEALQAELLRRLDGYEPLTEPGIQGVGSRPTPAIDNTPNHA